MAYRISRNIESSLIDFISAKLTEHNWTGFTVVKGFPNNYANNLPVIAIEALEIRPIKKEIGSKLHIKYFTVKIRLFANDDGQRLDVSDSLFEDLEDDVNYYVYTITNGVVSSKILSGKIRITRWFNNEKELVNTENLEETDRCRHLFSFECYVALS